MKDAITKEALFNHPIDKVWNAITVAEEISTWFIKADFKAKKGYQYTFTASEENGCVPITGEVKQAHPYTLIYTWIVSDTNVETTVKWELESTENGTKLYLEHSGISNYAGETAVAMFKSFNGGWINCITELTTYLKEVVNAG
ncbi:SRPBCC domain-containing protein [Yeosuana sp. MJ-SS3]|uniref:SRPBCC domain-containing protein n=1 Tax=Gilvirhabdus luticola TaxID=3079858 RepID=A0ABU3U4I5_9FLAO|nr:SRPBCC domain-containing protein [Yeosuana sp. MJ-SS3]MDU8885015.1 SRPBCC domain-containing protein [Yeosuana sp. MJ-SS3]